MGQIYDAAVDPAQWSGVLEAIANFLDSVRATLVIDDLVNPLQSVLYTSCVDTELAPRYLESVLLMHPLRVAAKGSDAANEIFLTLGFPAREATPVSCPGDAIPRTPTADVFIAILERTTTTTTLLSLERGVDNGPTDAMLQQKVGFIAPHLKRAAAMGRAFVQRKNHEANLAGALDRMPAAVFLLDPMGVVVHANQAAERLMAERRVVRNAAGTLAPIDRAGRQALARALAALRTGPAELGSRGILIPVSGDDRFVGTLIPIADDATATNGSGFRAAAILCIRPAMLETTDAAASFAERHGLTRRELAVLTAIVEHGGIAETAAALGISEGTAKGYVKAVFQKTGARRQADLVRMVAGFASPFK